jgi:formylmethanofuran dehydrogenase subunit E
MRESLQRFLCFTMALLALSTWSAAVTVQAAEGCNQWEGIPTITMRTSDKALTLQECLTGEITSPAGRYITIGIADVGSFHGDVCAGSAFGFRATQIAFSRLYPGEIPSRGDQFVIMNPERSCPTDAVSYVTGARYGKGAPETGIRNKNIIFDGSLPSFSFIFSSMSTGRSVKLISRFVLPKTFMDLREKVVSGKATPSEEERFSRTSRSLGLYILTAPEKEIFEVESMPSYPWKKYADQGTK